MLWRMVSSQSFLLKRTVWNSGSTILFCTSCVTWWKTLFSISNAGAELLQGMRKLRLPLSPPFKYVASFYGALFCLNSCQHYLKEDGIFANTFYEKEWLRKIRYTKYGFQHYEPAEVIQIAKAAGFRKVKVRKPQGEHSYCVIVKK